MASPKIWGGRFEQEPNTLTQRFTESISVDSRLFEYDILTNLTHAKMLRKIGILTELEESEIIRGLEEIKTDVQSGKIKPEPPIEDIHSFVEIELTKRIGDTAKKLHTAKSRNDQVVNDVKLWMRDAIGEINTLLCNLQRELVEAAKRNIDIIIPGYTHLQRAQPILAAHYYLAFVEKFQRDRDRLADCLKRVNVLPLGACALAGTTIPIDQEFVRKQLGFDSIARNSLDVSGDRDFAAEFTFSLCLIAIHLSNWAEDWIIWSTREFGLIQLSEEFCTGSSIMPQKKNPDVLELIRSRTGRVIASLQQLFITLKGLPTAYNRDLQEDKLAIFQAYDTIKANLEIATLVIRTSNFRKKIEMYEDQQLAATTFMEELILNGVPMRTAHEIVGKAVKKADRGNECELHDLINKTISEYMDTQTIIKKESIDEMLNRFKSIGSTCPRIVANELNNWEIRLN